MARNQQQVGSRHVMSTVNELSGFFSDKSCAVCTRWRDIVKYNAINNLWRVRKF